MALLVYDEHAPGEWIYVNQIYTQASIDTHLPKSFLNARDGFKFILYVTSTYLHFFTACHGDSRPNHVTCFFYTINMID